MAVNAPQGPIIITVSKTADGKLDYLQILSADQFSLNIVVISSAVTVRDVREKK